LRDIILTAIVFGSIPFILRQPYIGVLMWTWLSVMNPHRLTWSFAYLFPFAALTAVVTFLGIILSREPKRFPVTPVTVCLLFWIGWMSLTTLFAMNPESAWPEWNRAMKIQLMVLVTMMLIQTRDRLYWLVWVIVLSLGFYGFKGGIFTVLTGGNYMVWGPAGSFIEDNTSMALALIMVLPLMRYLQLTSSNKWVRRGLTVLMLVSAVAVLGSHSRGAFLAIAAMAGFWWLKSRYKAITAIIMILAIPVMLSLMPEKWHERMSTIQTYDQDASAMGRINAWWFAYNVAVERPIVGGGYNVFTPELFERYAPNPRDYHDAHSIYFEVLGEHGFVGLILFLTLMWLTWRNGSWIIRHTRDRQELIWARDLASMTQVCIVGYAVGGAFLGLAYFDLYYNLISLLVITKLIVKKEVESGRDQAWFKAAIPSAPLQQTERTP